MANTGQVPVQFEFVKKLNDKSFCKPWLSVEPSSGFIMPGDKSDLNVEVYVDKKTAGTLNSGSDQVDKFQYQNESGTDWTLSNLLLNFYFKKDQ